MISSIRYGLKNICYKNIRTYSNSTKKTSQYREARMLNKMFAKPMKKKNINVQTGTLSKVSQLEFLRDENLNRQGASLNKVYMEHVTELMRCGHHGSTLLNEGLQVMKVKLMKGGDFINIYWTYSNGKLTEEDIGKMLELAAKELQEQMGNIRYVSKTPYVRFVRDINTERAQIVEELLKIADFGEDHEQHSNEQSLDQPESVITAQYNLLKDELPEMRQNLLGVDHAKIKAKILTAIEIYKVTHTPKQDEYAYVEMENLIPFDKKTFAKFYKRKRILDRKLTSTGYFGSRRSAVVEEEEENEDEIYANEFLEGIKREQEEEEKEYAES